MLARDIFDLSGEVALVTGASSGIGARTAMVLAANGAKVALAARRTDKIEMLADEIQNIGGVALPIRIDVTDFESYDRVLNEIESNLGAVSILVNNAGIAKGSNTLDAKLNDWDMVIRTNMTSVMFLTKSVAASMIKHGINGRVINMASMLAYRSPRNATAYGASKAAVVQLTKMMSVDLADHGIRVNGVAPGYIETDLNRKYLSSDNGKKTVSNIPVKRVGTPSDLDGVMLLLASNLASAFMTGTVISVDGGHSCHFI